MSEGVVKGRGISGQKVTHGHGSLWPGDRVSAYFIKSTTHPSSTLRIINNMYIGFELEEFTKDISSVAVYI